MTRSRSLWRAVGAVTLFTLTSACASTSHSAPESLSDADVDRIAERVAQKMQTSAPMRADVPVRNENRAAGVALNRVPARASRRPTPAGPAVRVFHRPEPTNTNRPSPAVFGPIADVARTESQRAAAKCVDNALGWLARHQSPSGAWRADAFHEECDGTRCSGAGNAHYTPGLTGLAVLCLLGDGNTHTGGTYRDNVKNGLRYLRTIQDSEGCFGTRVTQHYMYNHALASLAMIESYGLTKSPIAKQSAQKAVNFILAAQNPYLGWRYGRRDGDNDTSMTAWMTMALSSAKQAGLDVDDSAFKGAVSWVDKMTEPQFGRVGYNRRGGHTARHDGSDRCVPGRAQRGHDGGWHVGAPARRTTDVARVRAKGCEAVDGASTNVEPERGYKRLLLLVPRYDCHGASRRAELGDVAQCAARRRHEVAAEWLKRLGRFVGSGRCLVDGRRSSLCDDDSLPRAAAGSNAAATSRSLQRLPGGALLLPGSI